MNQDWIELLELLNEHEADYIIVGAFALAHHKLPRFTGDLDIFGSSSAENSRKLYAALTEFGAPVTSLDEGFFTESGTTVTFGMPPVRVDFLNWISGVTWQEAVTDSEVGTFGPVTVKYLGLRTLRANKMAAGRPQDVADLIKLDELA
jgi:hypothetical protein